MLKKRTVKLLCWVRETLAVKNKQRKKHESYHEVFSSKKRHADTRSVFGRPLLRSLNPRFPPISALPSLLPPFLHLLLPFHLLHPSSLPTLSYLSLSLSVNETEFHTRWGKGGNDLPFMKHLLRAGHCAGNTYTCYFIEPSSQPQGSHSPHRVTLSS